MKKIAIVVQRYGLEVNGGAEYHARVLAEKLNLNEDYHITVLTTKSLDYHDWKNHYKEDNENINGISVKRFDVEEKNHKKFRASRRRILSSRRHHRIFKKINLFHFFNQTFNCFNPSTADGENFVRHQGPYCPNLTAYIKEKKEEYDVFIFFTYLYYPTVFGMREVSEKSIFIPTAHDEPLLYTKPFENIFSIPKFIMYNTESERKLVENHFQNSCKNTAVAGVGIEEHTIKDKITDDMFKYNTDYFIYIGRVEANKGCRELIAFFEKYSEQNPNIKLVLVGKKNIAYDEKSNSNIIFTGFVSEDEKYYLLKNAKALIIPSKYESLSLVTLESMLQEKIVIANEHCEVLKNHIDNSETGYLFKDYLTFAQSLENILALSDESYKTQGQKAKQYVEKNYSWDRILQQFDEAISFISNS